MSERPKINIPSRLVPLGNFETHEDIFGRGGFVTLTGSAEELGNENSFLGGRIPFLRRKVGMIVNVSLTDSTFRYYKCTAVGADSEDDGTWVREYFSGRYFHGAAAPTESDLQLGDRWFNTVVGSELVYIPIQEGSPTFAWVDLDHLGENPELSVFVRKDGDTMTGTLTGPDIFASNSIGGQNGLFTGSLTAENIRSNGNLSGITVTGTNANFSGSLTAGNIRSNGNLSGITITGNNATLSISGNSSETSITQPFLNVLRTGGEQETDRVGFTAGTSNFLNLPRIVLGDYSSNAWGWPSAIDFETRLTNGGENVGIGFRVGPLWSHSPPNITRSDFVFWGAPGKTEGGVGISGGLSGVGLERLGFFRYGVGLTDNGFHVKNNLYTEGTVQGTNFSGENASFSGSLTAGSSLLGGSPTANNKNKFSPNEHVWFVPSSAGTSGNAKVFALGYNHDTYDTILNNSSSGQQPPNPLTVGLGLKLAVNGKSHFWDDALIWRGYRQSSASFASNEFVTKSYVDNNAYIRSSNANPNINNFKWRFVRVQGTSTGGGSNANWDHLLTNQNNNIPYSITIDGLRDLGFGPPFGVHIIRISVSSSQGGGYPWMGKNNLSYTAKLNFNNEFTISSERLMIQADVEFQPNNNKIVLKQNALSTGGHQHGSLFMIHIFPTTT